MPFGLCNAPSAFQRQMNTMLGHLPFCVIYLHDILVFSKTDKEHQEHLSQVFDILRENQFYAKMSKCTFVGSTTKFLGFVVNSEGISMDPYKVAAIRNRPLPRSVSELRSFLGLLNHYKRFIEGYSIKVAPLHELTKLDAKNSGRFDLDEQSALPVFEWLKGVISEAPVLAVPNFEAPFYVLTDASCFGVGAVLQQEDLNNSDKVRRPIAFHIAKFSNPERNYPVGE